MRDDQKTKSELLRELDALRRRVAQLEKADRWKGEQWAIESEQTFRTIFNDAADGILLVDMESKKFRMANKAICQLLDYNSQEIKNLGVMDIHTEEDLPFVLEQFEKQARRKFTLSKNIPVRKKDGRVFYADINSFPIKLAGKTYLVGVFRDITERKRAEEALRESEEKYRSIFNTAASLITSIGANGVIVGCNARIKDVLGYERDEVVGQSIAKIIHPDYMEKAKTCLNEVLTVGFARHKEYKMVRKDNKVIDVEINAAGIKNKQGKYVEGICIIEDITERKEAEQALAESEEKFRSIFDNANDVVVSVTKTGKLVRVNKKAEGILGYKPDELVGKNILTSGILAKKNAATIVKLFKESVKRGGLWDIRDGRNVTEVWINHKDGHTVLLEASITTIKEDGKLEGFLSVLRDITERKLAEEALRESEEKYREIVELAPDGIVTVDLKGIVTSCNSALFQRTGYTKEDFVGQRLSKAPTLRLKDIPKYLRIFSLLPMGKTPKPFEFIWIHKDGSKHCGECHVSIMRRGGKITGFQAITREITERKKAEQAMQESEQKYKALVEQSLQGIIILQDFQIVFANPTAAKIAGLTVEEVLALSPEDIKAFIPAEEQAAILQRYEERLADKPVEHSYELRLVRKNGDGFWLNVFVSQIEYLGKSAIQVAFIDITERKWAEEALRQSEEKFRSIFDNANDIIASVTKTGKILEVNKKIEDILGYKLDELIGKNFMTLGILAAKNAAKMFHIFKESVKIGGFLVSRDGRNVTEVWVNHKDGHTVLLEANTTTIKEDGKLVGYLSVIRDITERKKAEEAYRSLVDHSLQGLAIFQNGRVVFSNQAMAEITGYTVEEMLTLPPEQVQAFVHPDDRELVWNRHRGRLNGEELPERYEFRGIRKDGSICWLEIHASRIEFQGKHAIQAAYVDITERMKAEEALHESEQKYRTLVESAGESIATINEDGVFLFMNKTSAKRLGGKPEDYMGKTMWDVFPKKIADQQAAGVRKVIHTGKERNVVALTELQGQLRWYNTTIEPLRDDSGKVIAAMVIARDIHELKQAEEELNKYREQMAQAEQLASVGTLSASLAHELTQPLTVVRLSIENSLAELEKTSCPDTVVEDLKEGLSEVSSIASIVNRFRNFARRSSEIKVAEVDLKAVAERIVELLDESAWRAKVTLQVEGMDKLPPIYSHEKDLERLFFSLIENAIQAADGKKSRQVIISDAVIDEHIELQFSDNCGGIAPENLDKIFEPFFTTKPTSERTGLGLCVVERIVSQLGGKVRVESKLGKGSTFFVTLPIKGDER